MPDSDDRDKRFVAVIKSARQRQSDLAIIRMIRVAMLWILALGAVFVVYIAALLISSAHDNHRIDELEQRVQKVERR